MPVETTDRTWFDEQIKQLTSAGLTKTYIASVCHIGKQCMNPNLHDCIAVTTLERFKQSLPTLRHTASLPRDEQRSVMRARRDSKRQLDTGPKGYVDARIVALALSKWIDAGISQIYIAKHCGLSENMISKVMTGKTRHMKKKNALAIKAQCAYFDELAHCTPSTIDLEMAVARPGKPRVCKHCKRPFTSHGTRPKEYCSKECLLEHQRNHRKRHTARIPVDDARKTLIAFQKSGGSISKLAMRHNLSRHTLHKIISGEHKEVIRSTYPKLQACLDDITNNTAPMTRKGVSKKQRKEVNHTHDIHQHTGYNHS